MEKDKTAALKKLTEYEKSTEIIVAPCYNEKAGEIFSFYLDDNHYKKYLWEEGIKLFYPFVKEEDAEVLYGFMRQVEEYCVDVCSCMSDMYDCPFVPHEETAEAIAKRIINVCHKRFPWIKIEDIEGILNKCMWLSNR